MTSAHTDDAHAAAELAERIATGTEAEPKFPVGSAVHYVPAATGRCIAATITDRQDSPDDLHHIYQLIVCFPAQRRPKLLTGLPQAPDVTVDGGWVQVMNVHAELIGIEEDGRTGSVHAGFIHALHL